MDKKKIICNSILLGVAIFLLVGCLTGVGFSAFQYWEFAADMFEEGFFSGLAFVFAPLNIIVLMMVILVQIYVLLRTFNVVKENKFDKAFPLVRNIVYAVALVVVGFTALTAYNMGY